MIEPKEQQVQEKQVAFNIDSDSSSSYLSECSDDQDDYEHILALRQKCNMKSQEQIVLKKSDTSGKSTSQYEEPQTKIKANSQKNKSTNSNSNSINNDAKSANSDPSNNTITHKNKSKHYFHQDTLDLNEMLRILDQSQKQHQPVNSSKKKPLLDQFINSPYKQFGENDDNFNLIKQKSNSHYNFGQQFKQPSYTTTKFNNQYPNFRGQQQFERLYELKNQHYYGNFERYQHHKPFNRYQKLHPSYYHHNQPSFYPPRQTLPFNPPYQKPHRNQPEQFASQNFVFWGILISIKLSSFMTVSKNVLVVPFANTSFSDPVSKIVQSKIKYNLKEISLKQAIKLNQREIPDGNVFSVKAKGLESNYRGIYFMKSPQNMKQSMKYFDVSRLKKGIQKIFSLLDSHRQQHVVFPQFQWGSLTQSELCELLIGGIFREINSQKKNYKCQYLREVVVCASNCEVFQIYCKFLRYYVKQLSG